MVAELNGIPDSLCAANLYTRHVRHSIDRRWLAMFGSSRIAPLAGSKLAE
jgi:hypothetical protein